MNTANNTPDGGGWMDSAIYHKYANEYMRENSQPSTPVRRKRPRIVKPAVRVYTAKPEQGKSA